MSAIYYAAKSALFCSCTFIIIVFAGQEAGACPGCGVAVGIAPPRFKIVIDSNTPLRDLLPVVPKRPPAGKAVLCRDLANAPEVQFGSEAILTEWEKSRPENQQRAAEGIARQLAAINHLNAKKTDHFMEELLRNRPDLAGLPFTLGDACRHENAQAKKFGVALAVAKIPLLADKASDPAEYWKAFDDATVHVRNDMGKKSEAAPYVPENRLAVAALMQIFPGQARDFQRSLAKEMPRFDHADADKNAVTEALVRLAVFSQDEPVRAAALESLQGRDTKVADAVVLKGLRYPWPSVARNAADLVVKLRRIDLAGELKKMLEEPDPRAPVLKEVEGKKVVVMRELVRVNHLRNCMLCHPAVNASDFPKLKSDEGTISLATISQVFLVGAVPIPGTEMPSGYGSLAPPVDLVVRADVTYLRQDFSLLEKVAAAAPWPEVQRFDYLVRNRVLSDSEKTEFDAVFASQENEYHRIASSAVRRLRDR